VAAHEPREPSTAGAAPGSPGLTAELRASQDVGSPEQGVTLGHGAMTRQRSEDQATVARSEAEGDKAFALRRGRHGEPIEALDLHSAHPAVHRQGAQSLDAEVSHGIIIEGRVGEQRPPAALQDEG
jgi:hypothetical protein